MFDLYVHEPMQKIVTDKLRPPGTNDAYGVELARARLARSFGVVDTHMAAREWAVGETFTMADCVAAPALYYANKVAALTGHAHAARYLERLTQRPSMARVLTEAEPYFAMFPG